MSGEKYFIIKKEGIQIHLFADVDLDDVILNRQELYKVFKEAGFEIKETPAEPPYESFVKSYTVTVTAESRRGR